MLPCRPAEVIADDRVCARGGGRQRNFGRLSGSQIGADLQLPGEEAVGDIPTRDAKGTVPLQRDLPGANSNRSRKRQSCVAPHRRRRSRPGPPGCGGRPGPETSGFTETSFFEDLLNADRAGVFSQGQLDFIEAGRPDAPRDGANRDFETAWLCRTAGVWERRRPNPERRK